MLPATVKESNPSAFPPGVWRVAQFDEPPPLFMNAGFLRSIDEGTKVNELVWRRLLSVFH
jgi:hypothetical protein